MGRERRGHQVTIDIYEPEYRRYKFLDNNKRILLLDMRCIRTEPFHPIDYGARRSYIWNNPAQLQGMVDEYFESCFGPIRDPKTGGFYTNEDGSLARGQIKPFTISGLALYCHIDTQAIKMYSDERINALGFPLKEDYSGPSYSQIMRVARKRIENYAEERLYDRDGFGGGKFVLNAAFNWTEKKEQAEIKAMKEQTKLKKKELKFRKQQAAIGEGIEEPVTITIKRAGAEDDSE